MTTKYLSKLGETGEKLVLTKDQGFKAVGKILGKVRKLTGLKQSDFMDKYFAQVWDSHDKEHDNSIPADDVQSFFDDMLKVD